jgi:hypothetical protein
MTGAADVIFGTGPARRAVATALLDHGARARMVNRSGTSVLTGVETIGGDATDPEVARDVAAGADTVYVCLNVREVIGRASDFVGPGGRDSAVGRFAFEPALADKRARTMGRPATLHTYSYAPDVGRNLVLLGWRDDAYGRARNLPNPETRTKRPMLRTLELCNGNVRELLHTDYQFPAPIGVDDSALRHAFGGRTTPWADIVASTRDWYRAHATTPQSVPGLAEATPQKVAA